MSTEILNIFPFASLILTIVIVSITSALLFRFIPQVERLTEFLSIRYFVLTFMGIALAFSSFTLRPYINEAISIILNNGIYLFSVYCFIYGLKHRQNTDSKTLHEQARFFFHLALLLVVNVGLFYFYDDNFISRVMFLHLNIAILFLYSLTYVSKQPHQPTSGETLLSFVLVTSSALTMVSPILLIFSQELSPYISVMGALQSIQLHIIFGALCILLLTDTIEHLYQRSTTDDLTGIYNRRHFIEQSTEYMNQISNPDETSCAVILCDIDHFKKINASYGHKVGDQVIIQVAQHLCRMIRQDDIIARTGGQEFAVFLPKTNLMFAEAIAERMRQQLTKITMNQFAEHQDINNTLKNYPHITASFGVTVYSATTPFDQLLNSADLAMYQAKHAGRNQTHTHIPAPMS